MIFSVSDYFLLLSFSPKTDGQHIKNQSRNYENRKLKPDDRRQRSEISDR